MQYVLRLTPAPDTHWTADKEEGMGWDAAFSGLACLSEDDGDDDEVTALTLHGFTDLAKVRDAATRYGDDDGGAEAFQLVPVSLAGLGRIIVRRCNGNRSAFAAEWEGGGSCALITTASSIPSLVHRIRDKHPGAEIVIPADDEASPVAAPPVPDLETAAAAYAKAQRDCERIGDPPPWRASDEQQAVLNVRAAAYHALLNAALAANPEA